MRQEMTISARLDQKMILAPRMIQSMEILQLPIMALQERIQQELQENPVLELKDAAEEPTAEADFNADAPAPAETPPDFDRLEALNKDWENSFNEDHRPSRNGMDEEGDRKHDAMQNMASRPQSLQEYLTDQLVGLDATAEQVKLMRHVIAHIADTGYLG